MYVCIYLTCYLSIYLYIYYFSIYLAIYLSIYQVDDSENGGNNFAKELDVIFRRNSGLTAGTFTKVINQFYYIYLFIFLSI